MYRIVLLLAAAAVAEAGTIQGVVLEHVSGRPLARTVVRLEPVPQAGSPPGLPMTTRAGRSGSFVFPTVAPGLYILMAIRDGYFPAAFGQHIPIGRGRPITVTADSSQFAELRLRHKGALTGRILDENGVGTANVPVVAYRARLPLRLAGSTVSDDRGVYRIHGLEPGKYWVRSSGHTLDDGSGWLPTFGPQTRDAADARIHRVGVDADTTDADISPDPGGLFHLGGTITCDSDPQLGASVTVTISSQNGQRSAQTACASGYRFDGLAPGPYEVLAQLTGGPAAGFTELILERDNDTANIAVLRLPTVAIEVRRAGSNALLDTQVTLIARRLNQSEPEPIKELKGPRAALTPGHWEVRATAPPGQYLESIVNVGVPPRNAWRVERPADWFDVFIESRSYSRLRVSLSDQAGQINGRVQADSSVPAPGVPVFLWPVAEAVRRSLGGVVQGLSDTEGRFQFNSLPAGEYRILASFDVNEMDEEVIEQSHAAAVRVEASQAAAVTLSVWVANQ